MTIADETTALTNVDRGVDSNEAVDDIALRLQTMATANGMTKKSKRRANSISSLTPREPPRIGTRNKSQPDSESPCDDNRTVTVIERRQ